LAVSLGIAISMGLLAALGLIELKAGRVSKGIYGAVGTDLLLMLGFLMVIWE